MVRRLLVVLAGLSGVLIGSADGWAQQGPPPSQPGAAPPPVGNSVSTFTAGPSTANAVLEGATQGLGGSQNVFKGALASHATGVRGFAAGDGPSRIGLWTNLAGTWFEEDQVALSSSGTIATGLVGADYRINDWFILGLSAGYERQDITTHFNLGSIDSNGYIVAPYLLVQLIPDQLFLDLSGGYVGAGQTIDRTLSGRAVSGSPDAQRVFTTATLQANLERGAWRLRPETGVLWLNQHIDGYAESSGIYIPGSNAPLGRFHVGSRIAYNFGRIEPYALAQFEYDFKTSSTTVDVGLPQPSTRRTGGVLGTGVLFQLMPGLFGGLQFSASVGRADYAQYNLGGTLRYGF
ncbi:MAG: autotransporter outer membrane beta-barrel domain-containing protein [Alphaproteobacteria bacterium]